MKEINVVCGIIEKDDKVLIAKRGKGTDEGFWEFPGGKVEENESKEDAILRELYEELNVLCEIKCHVLDFDDVRNDLVLHLSAFKCKLISNEFILSAHTEYRWVHLNELLNYEFQKADTILIQTLQKTL